MRSVKAKIYEENLTWIECFLLPIFAFRIIKSRGFATLIKVKSDRAYEKYLGDILGLNNDQEV